MKRFVEGEDRRQGALLPHCLDDYVTENNPVRVIEALVDELDLAILDSMANLTCSSLFTRVIWNFCFMAHYFPAAPFGQRIFGRD